MRYRIAIVVGIVVAAATALSAQPVYQLHDNGNIWVYTQPPCSGASCPGWKLLGNNPSTREITAGGEAPGGFTPTGAPPVAAPLYQRHADGKIWQYTGTPCSSDRSCPGWQLLDDNPLTVSIVAAGMKHLYQRRSNGAIGEILSEIWSYTGEPCRGGSCPGWQRLDNNPNTAEIIAAGDELYQRHNDGTIWRYKERTPCNETSCPGWELLDNNPNTAEITARVGFDGVVLYQRRHVDGKILRYTGTPCSSDTSCPEWQLLDNDERTISIVTSRDCLYQLRKDGTIWVYATHPCNDAKGQGWQLLDNNPRSRQITAGPRSLYQRQDDGAILRYTGPQCSGGSCPGWQLLDKPPTRTIVSTRN